MFRPSVCVARSQARGFSSTIRRPFLGNFFGSKESKKEELIKKQDEYEVDPTSKIVILDESNSPNTKAFDPAEDLPEFAVSQWKQHVHASELRGKFTAASVAQAMKEVHQDLTGASPASLEEVALHDLEFRFKYVKALQQKLGFDINDFTISQSHDLATLHAHLKELVETRYTSERNPNAIVLERGDFTARNVYLNEERTPAEQERAFKELVEKARAEAEV